MDEKERIQEENRKKNPLEKIADMTVEMAKLVLVVQALSGIKKEGKEQGFAEISDEKLSNIIGIDKSRIGGKNGLIFEAVQKGYLCANSTFSPLVAYYASFHQKEQYYHNVNPLKYSVRRYPYPLAWKRYSYKLPNILKG